MKPASFLLVSFVLAACAQHADEPPVNDVPPTDEAEQPDSAAAPPANPVVQAPATAQGPDSARGTVVVTSMGPASRATLSSGAGPPILLAGPLEPELRQLSGAEVIVFGELSGAQRRSLDVQHYDVLAIDGEQPIVGMVLPGGAHLEAGTDTLTVVGQPEPLPAGAKIWIVGRREGAELRLQSWGVIRRQ